MAITDRIPTLPTLLTAALALLTACGGRQDAEPPEPDISQERHGVSVTLSIGTPGQDEVIYTRTRIQNGSETDVSTLTLFDFPVAADGTVLPLDSIYHLTPSEDSGIPAPGHFTESDGTLSASCHIAALPGMRHILMAVANELPEYLAGKAVPGVTTIDAACLIPSGKSFADGASSSLMSENGGFTMSGMTGILTETAQRITGGLSLERVSARLDVKNNIAANLDSDVRILGVSVRNAAASGCLSGKYAGGSLTASDFETVTATVGMTDGAAEALPRLERGATYGGALYFYEQPFVDGKPAPSIMLTYSINGETAETEVSPAPGDDGGTGFYIRRNHLYTLVVGGTPSTAPGALTCKLIRKE